MGASEVMSLADSGSVLLNIKRARLMVVDDEKINIRLLTKMLEVDGYENIISTDDPREVVGMYQQQGSDLIILDLNMPHMDGFEVMEALKGLDVNLPPVLVLTAQHAQEYRQKALDNGAHDYVTKPFDRSELLSRARNLLELQLSKKCLRNQNEILEQKVQERTQEIRETRLQIIRRLGRAAEYRDNETGLHIIRMSQISALLGHAEGMNESEVELLLNASPMHDIGKIGIPDHILLKPGKLESNEWEIMKTHVTIGADILSGDDSDLLIMARDIAITHHEKWDGSGYPNGLKGEKIPLVGRITAIADVFDALTSVRPYKKAWPISEAVEYIKGESGKHFDPYLVERFIENLPAIEKIKEDYAEPDDVDAV